MSTVRMHFPTWLFWASLSILYVVVHFPGLTSLPVFADEAIYIRWSQLILSDWSRYLLFPINDGKTPLFIWMLVPFLKSIADPLWAGRFLSVIGGWFQMALIIFILKELRVNRVGQLIGGLIVILAPFWFFHHRMVLMDGWLTVWVSLATLAILKVSQKTEVKRTLLWLVLGGIAVWAGMMTKVPFLLALPALVLLPLVQRRTSKYLRRAYGYTATLIILGISLFAVLSVSSVFPQLLSRGSDFLLPISEVLGGRWQETLPSVPTYLGYFFSYTGWGVLLLALFSLVLPGKRRAALILVSSFILFSLPIWLLGRVVYPRYLFPAMLYVTLLAGIGAGTLWRWSNESVQTGRRRLAVRSLVFLLTFQMIVTSLQFAVPSWFSPAHIPFVSADQGQYLTSWSSGHGLVETMKYLENLQHSKTSGKILVATEGNFGSLPDGLLLYNFKQPLEHVWIEGIGYPVTALTTEFYAKIEPEDTVLLVVNSDRLQWQLNQNDLLQHYCRPLAGPCLQIWDITQIYSQFKKN